MVGFRIQKLRIPESTIINVPDSRIRNPLHTEKDKLFVDGDLKLKFTLYSSLSHLRTLNCHQISLLANATKGCRGVMHDYKDMVVNRATIEVTLDCEQSLIFFHSWWNKNIERREREYQASNQK